MFKGGRWKSEKHKSSNKAVFKIQFQATQVPQFGWDRLMVAVVPSETVKSTTKTEKVQVCNGVCRWEKPIYENMKLTRDEKTGKMEMKTYQFIVCNGMTVGGFLGKATIDFAEYADAIDPFSVSLPLRNSYSTVLHVTIQRLCTEHTGENKRKGETRMVQNCKSFEDNIRNWDTIIQMAVPELPHAVRSAMLFLVEIGRLRLASMSKHDKCSSNGRMQLSPFMRNTVARTSESSGNLSCSFSTILESSSAHCSSRHDFSHFKNSGNKDAPSFLSSLKRKALSLRLLAIEHNDVTNHTEYEDSNVEYDISWAQKDNRQSRTDAFQETDTNEKLQAAEISMEELKNQIAITKRQKELSDLEVQALRKHIGKENKRMQETLRETCSLRKERDVILEQLNVLNMQEKAEVMNSIQYGSNDFIHILSTKRELDYEKKLNADLHLQLQKIQESNSELIFKVQDLEEQLQKKEQETTLICSSRSSTPETRESCPQITDSWQKNKCEIIQYSTWSKTEEDQAQLELELLIEKHNCRGNASSPEVIVSNLQSEIAEHKTGHDKLQMQMEQLALDYEILKQENHKLKESYIQEQLKMQHEVSISLSVINDQETHIQNLENEFIKQEEAFVAELATLTRGKVEQEQRAIKAEELLRKTRQSNADAAEHLQEEFRNLSFQVSSMFKTNEKLTSEAIKETNNLRIQKSRLEKLLNETNEAFELTKDQYKEKIGELSAQLDTKACQIKKLQSEVEYLTREIQSHTEAAEAKSRGQLNEIVPLKTDPQTLPSGKNNFFHDIQEKECIVEMEEMKNGIEENVPLLQREESEREIFQRQILIPKHEEEEPQLEEQIIRNEPVDKNLSTGNNNKVDHPLSEDQFEKENLNRHEVQKINDLKREDTITSSGKKIVNNNNLSIVANNEKRKECPRSNKISYHQHSIKKSIMLKEKIKLLQESHTQDCKSSSTACGRKKAEERINGNSILTRMGTGTAAEMLDHVSREVRKYSSTILNSRSGDKISNRQTYDEDPTIKLIDEIAKLKAKNTLMEDELKEMQERYSQISLRFAEVEGERQHLVMTVRNLKNGRRS